ncbi:EpsG family protein [Caballeronia insecticola]|uniref:EpsG family protein n=1 Tax=Caballeronia insecticola TaxID=758793 RepID=UPI001183809E|nr:EpsG family protein [Caballeronia insecticola]
MRKTPGSFDLSRPQSVDRPFFATPAGWAFVLLASYILWFLATSERSIYRLPDQEAYIAYFRYTDWNWLERYFQRRGFSPSLIPRIVTDEIGWRIWILFVNAFGFTPDTAIRITVVLANGLVFLALTRLRRPLTGLLLWIVIPSALCVTGLFQIRQGFAFAIAVLFAIVFRRPVLGLLIASTIHTTVAFPALLLIAARLSGPNNRTAITLVSIAGAMLSMSAQMLFDTFGGRRLGDYAGYQAEFSVNLLVLMLSYSIGSMLLMTSLPYIRALRLRSSMRELALMHFGLVVYLVFAFTLFPFGKDRVFYYISLMLPFFVQEIRVKDGLTLWMLVVLYFMIFAEAFLAYQKGVYAYFLK